MSCVGMTVGAGFAWPIVAVVAGAVSMGFACAVAVCCDGSVAGLAVDWVGFTGSAAACDASGLGFGTGTLRLATRGTEAGGRGPLPRWADGSSGPGGPYAEFRTPS